MHHLSDGRRRRWRRIMSIVEGLLLVLGLIVALSGCGHGPTQASPSPHAVAAVVAHNANEQAPLLSPAVRSLLAATTPAGADDATLYVVSAGSAGASTVDLEPRRPNGQVERGPRRDALSAQRLDAAQAAILAAAASGTGTDLLAALDAASRTGASTIVVLSGGLSTTDPLDLRAAGWDSDPHTVAVGLAQAGQLPDLSGRTVVLSGLGRTAGPQPELGVHEQQVLREIWSAVCTEPGGRCSIDDSVRPAAPPVSTLKAPIVPVPTLTTVPGPAGTETVVVPAPLLFAPDSCTMIDSSRAAILLAPMAARLRSGSATVAVSGRTAPVGPGTGTDLAACRARAAAALLVDHLGVPADAIGPVTGDGSLLDPPEATLDATGRPDPIRLAALRRVVFTVSPKGSS